MSSGKNKLAPATATDDKVAKLFTPQQPEVVGVETWQGSGGDLRPIIERIPSFVAQAIEEARESKRSVVAVSWTANSNSPKAFDIDLYAIKGDERVFFRERFKAWGVLHSDIRSSTSDQDVEKPVVDKTNWEIIEVDGGLEEYEWIINNFDSSEEKQAINISVVYQDTMSDKLKTWKLEWSSTPDQGSGFDQRHNSPSWRPLPEIR
jgi:hypothetical protein